MPVKYSWTPQAIKWAQDTSLSGVEVANRLNISNDTVCKYRREHGIPQYKLGGHNKIKWPRGIEERLGKKPDSVIADEVGCHKMSVTNLRNQLGIKSWKEQQIPLGKRRKRMAELPNTLTREQWHYACDWFDSCCAYCGAEAGRVFLTEDHLVPISKGGPRTALNILPCCWSCNSSKQSTRADTWIYWRFGIVEGQEVIDRIVTYLTEVQGRLKP